MGSFAVSAVVLVSALASAACGVVSLTVLRGAGLTRTVAFGWGASLGPIGIVVAAAIATRSRATSGHAAVPRA
jgi:hypothetical protein